MRSRIVLIAFTVLVSVLAVTPSSEARRWRRGGVWYGGGVGLYGGGYYGGGPGWSNGWGYGGPAVGWNSGGWGTSYGGGWGGGAACCDTGYPTGAEVISPAPAVYSATPANWSPGVESVCCY